MSNNIPDKRENVIRIDFERISRAAKEKGLSVRAIAAQAGGVTHGAVHDVMTGKYNDAKALKLKSICDVLGIPVEEVFVEKAAA